MTFGDWDPDDAYDRAPPAPEQVTYRLHELRLEVDALAGGLELPTWDELEPDAQELAEAMGVTITGFMVARGAGVSPVDVARHLHNARRFVATSRLAAWDELDVDDRQIGIDLMTIVRDWLVRQGALG